MAITGNAHQHKLVAMLDLDVKNFAPREAILRVTRGGRGEGGIPTGLLQILKFYLSGRSLEAKADGPTITRETFRGVPQSLVLRP